MSCPICHGNRIRVTSARPVEGPKSHYEGVCTNVKCGTRLWKHDDPKCEQTDWRMSAERCNCLEFGLAH